MVAPDVEALGQILDVILATLCLYWPRVEEPLWCPNDLARGTRLFLGHKLQGQGTIFPLDLLHARDKPDYRLAVCFDAVNKAEIAGVGSTLDSDPLVLLKGCLADLGTDLEHLGHVAVGYHLHAFLEYSCYAVNDGVHVAHVVSLNVQAAAHLVAAKHRQDHEGLLAVQEIEGLPEKLHCELPLLPLETLDLPDLGIED